MNLKRLLSLMLPLLLMAALVGCGDVGMENGVEQEEDAVAIVNGEPVPREEFDQMLEMRMEMYEMQEPVGEGEEAAEMEEMLKQQTLDELIAQTVIMQNAEAEGIAVEEDEIEEQYQLLKGQYGEEEFQTVLEEQNMSPESLRENIANQLVIQEYVEKKAAEELGEEALEVSEDELKALYEQHSMQMEDLPEFEEMKPQLIEMAQQDKMQEVTGEIVNQLIEESDIEVLL